MAQDMHHGAEPSLIAAQHRANALAIHVAIWSGIECYMWHLELMAV